ncbi:hypothetical protein HDV01_003953, partial [Terramyces sp. JEL0728]
MKFLALLVSAVLARVPDSIVMPYVDADTFFSGADRKQNPDVVGAINAEGVKYYRLAFVNAQTSTQTLVFGGELVNFFTGYVSKIRNAGGEIIMSFGGQGAGSNGRDEISAVFGDVNTIYNQYLTVIQTYKPAGLDFDIESGNNDATILSRRFQAIQKIKTAFPDLTISLTVAVGINGLVPGTLGYQVVQAAGVATNNFGKQLIDVVNVMAMDYAVSDVDGTTTMGQYAVNSATGAYKQLQQLGLVSQISNTKVGITVQIGYNTHDDTAPQKDQIFYPGDVDTVVNFAQANSYISFLSYWELARDHAIYPEFPQTGPECFKDGQLGILENSCVEQTNLEFLHKFKSFNSPAGYVVSPTTSAPPSTQTQTSPDGSCGSKGNGLYYVCTPGNCCNVNNFCGSTDDYCKNGCQPLFGDCPGKIVPTTTPAHTTTVPVVKTTTVAPAPTTTVAPVVKTTTVAPVPTTTIPVVQTTTAPIVQTTTAPIVQTTTIPVAQTTTIPV